MIGMTQNEILHIVHVLAFLAKINNVVEPAEKGIFKIVCERFKIGNSDLKIILKESFSLKESLDKIHSKESKRILVNLVVLMASVDGYLCDSEENSVFKIIESLGESTKDYFYFNDDGNLDIQTVIDNELNILSELPPTHPI